MPFVALEHRNISEYIMKFSKPFLDKEILTALKYL